MEITGGAIGHRWGHRWRKSHEDGSQVKGLTGGTHRWKRSHVEVTVRWGDKKRGSWDVT